jgi:hypothetical protein
MRRICNAFGRAISRVKWGCHPASVRRARPSSRRGSDGALPSSFQPSPQQLRRVTFCVELSVANLKDLQYNEARLH